MSKLSKKYIAALDIGSSKIACFIAKRTSDDSLEIIGIGYNNSQGVKNGVIVDINLAKDAICNAVKAAEDMAKVNINQVRIGLNAQILESHLIKARISVLGREINQRDILKLLHNASEKFDDEKTYIVNCIPLSYQLDQIEHITDPKGMHGRTLEADIHVVTAPSSAIINIASCLAKCHLDIKDFVPSPYASALACLSLDEKNLGAVLIDFGCSSTSVAILKNNRFVFFDSIPIGGMHVTKDIAIGLSVKVDCAQRLKTIHGNVISTSKDAREIIDIPENSLEENSHISDIPKSALINIIRPRVEEIVELIKEIIDKRHLSDVGNVIVITGGASNLSGLKTYVAEVFNKNVKIGNPNEIEGMAESTKGTSFSNVAGILEYAKIHINQKQYDFNKFGSNLKNPFSKLLNWLKENF